MFTVSSSSRSVLVVLAGVLLGSMQTTGSVAADRADQVSASSTVEGTSPAGAIDGDRFSTALESLWQGTSASASWQMTFAEPRRIGAILQIHGDDPEVLQNAPRNYIWQTSSDGRNWHHLLETMTYHERRLFRIHRLREAVETRHIRLLINLSHGLPAVREIEFYEEVDAEIAFPDWIIGVSSLEDPDSAAITRNTFIRLARLCEGWETVPAQCLWHGDFDPDFVSVEPRPLCAFFSGSHLEWCQRSREPWRGVQEVLQSRRLPMWGACGGAQVLAILDQTGVDHPWDCPRCRDPQQPRSPVYSHIGFLGDAPCGDYRQNVAERGRFQMRITAEDPVFSGISEIFTIHQSHIGQIDYVPEGWIRVVTRGPGAHTVNQCLRVVDAPIYAAQFHMETYAQTWETSKTITTNFLRMAKQWGGYNPRAQRLERPTPRPEVFDEP